jgi:hypothetical protein
MARSIGAAGLAALLGIGAGATQAQTGAPPPVAKTLAIELNRLEQRADACRLSFVYRNRLGTTLDLLQLEAVLFDRQERVERFVVFSSKGLPDGKIRVQQFDIAGLRCPDLGAVLVNDVKACDGDGLEAANCLKRLDLRSNADAKLISLIDQ